MINLVNLQVDNGGVVSCCCHLDSMWSFHHVRSVSVEIRPCANFQCCWEIRYAKMLSYSVVDDACVAMEDWTANPSAHTVLDEYLPCGNTIIINSPVDQMTQIVNDTINGINKGIETHVNNASTSSQIPLLCNPSLLMLASLSPPAPRASDCVNISNAAQVIFQHQCLT